jgi:hypothetical protein
MKVRRVVAADSDGKAVIAEDGSPPRGHDFEHVPGMAMSVVWSTEPGDDRTAASDDRTTEITSLVPGPGGTRFLILQLPPQTVFGSAGFDPVAAGAEVAEHQPGIAELMEPDAPGKHRTPTIDYSVVIEGELFLEQDEAETKLGVGDVIVQAGSRHSWSVRTEEPAKIAAVLVGISQS